MQLRAVAVIAKESPDETPSNPEPKCGNMLPNSSKKSSRELRIALFYVATAAADHACAQIMSRGLVAVQLME